MSDLRNRKKAPMAPLDDKKYMVGGLRLNSMMEASPQQTGQLPKLRVSALFLLLPPFIRQWILKWSCLRMARPSWKNRSVVLLGSYLYKFADDGVRHVGAPVEVTAMDASLLEPVEAEHLGISECLSLIPESYAVIRVSTPRKSYYYACESQEEALVWIRSLRDAKQEAIRRSMGHADAASYPKSWGYFDSLGKATAATKARVRQRMENNNLRELEMSSLMDSGPLPRGYFG